ncbi:MarR family winged helix-turn-helix transcriptional regulator [Frondihabitans australicus]|uniref:DNA-binding MarR family transcriptional regulator n=1 Tax=Frondihabitans australicus TaxID=386892 RepID=A0A495IIY0_9MICO|nr:MarR family transcriptional regulator [Frondihabitans australicus]RKR75954.1 DNA-binding MarR family transcriptional regulator [Frondihabitans australicus]
MNASAPVTLDERLGILLKSAQSVLHQSMGDALRPLDLTVPQYACLQGLADSPGITSSELARRAFVSRQSMNVLLQGLQDRGLVTRSESPGPRRERAATLTPAAVELGGQARALVAVVASAMRAPLDDADARRLAELLEACRDALLARPS